MDRYNDKDIDLYSKLGIKGTTYEPSLNELGNIISQLNLYGLCLDIGSGTGRVTNLIKYYAPNLKNVLGIDHDKSMVSHANSKNEDPSIYYALIDKLIPIADSSVELAVCANVLEEISNAQSMMNLLKEIYRVVKPGGKFIIVTANPEAMKKNAQFKTYSYENNGENLKDGDEVTCTVSSSDSIIVLTDAFWSNPTVKNIIEKAGFRVEETKSPQPEDGDWKDELKVAPDNIWVCTKN